MMKKIYILSFALVLSSSVFAQWTQQEVEPTCNFSSISFVDENHGWLSGFDSNYNRVFCTPDGGKEWSHCEKLDIPFSTYLDSQDIYFINQNYGWISAEGILKHTNSANKECNAEWTVQNLQTNPQYIKPFFIDSIHGWLRTMYIPHWGMASYAFYRTVDGGNNWIYTGYNFPVNDLHFIDQNKGWIIGGGLWYTDDGGITWSQRNNEVFGSDIFFIDSEKGWICDHVNNVLWHTDDGGYTLYMQIGDSVPRLNDITFSDELNGWAVGNEGSIVHTSNGGLTWENQESGTSEDLKCVSFIDQYHGWICGENGIVLHTENGGIVGIENPKKEIINFIIYPNPTHSAITIELPTKPSKNTSLTISNTNGQQLIRQPITEPQTEINISHLHTGIYIVKVWNNKEVMVRKVIKQ